MHPKTLGLFGFENKILGGYSWFILRQSSILQDLEDEISELATMEEGTPASCAPVLDCVHAGHDLLEARLFLT